MPSSIHILLDGRVTTAGRDSAASTVDAPAALGLRRSDGGPADARNGRTAGSAVTLVLTVEELRTLLADNTDLVSGLFATLAERSEGPDRAVHSTGAVSELGQLANGGLTAIDRVFALKYVPLFQRVSADEMQQLAMVAAPVKMTVDPCSSRNPRRPRCGCC